ncbi:hypothetical protein M6B38_347175 [Iris pallida]|uniref:Uncharacterized protein n=1 Tax=Iris pallida TaxID=29817 RepID=A0AAX6GSS6_IRIPA|nr:hypothetical protein M6B38_347175 [Iris pallida]
MLSPNPNPRSKSFLEDFVDGVGNRTEEVVRLWRALPRIPRRPFIPFGGAGLHRETRHNCWSH